MAAAGALIGGGLSIAGANSKNAALEARARAANEAYVAQVSALRAATAQQRLENIRRVRLVTGGILANAASDSGSTFRIVNATLAQGANADRSIRTTEMNRISGMNSELRSGLSDLQSSGQSPLLAALQGGLSGAQVGMQIGQLASGLSSTFVNAANSLEVQPATMSGGPDWRAEQTVGMA
jgi:hypothetical protein